MIVFAFIARFLRRRTLPVLIVTAITIMTDHTIRHNVLLPSLRLKNKFLDCKIRFFSTPSAFSTSLIKILLISNYFHDVEPFFLHKQKAYRVFRVVAFILGDR